jgi:hypothetical protein
MATSTPNFGWQLPVPNSPVDANVWGTELNGNISSQDTLLLSAFTNNISNTAPVSPILTAGSTWINNTNPSAYIFNIYDGSQWVQMGTIDPIAHAFFPVGTSGIPNVRIFTSSGTYTPSAGLVYAIVEGVAGGGSGSASSGNAAGCVGGGGGSYFWSIMNAGTIGASQVITIGAGGAGVSPTNSGNIGQNTSFGSLMTAYGGTGGNPSNSIPGIGGAVAIGGLVNLPGGDGLGSISPLSGCGGSSPVFGQLTGGSLQNVAGKTGYGYGSGGAGGGFMAASGAGAPGIIRIIEYL